MPTPIRPVRVLREFAWYPVGHIIPEMPPGQARDMVANGWAEYADTAEPAQTYKHRMMAAPVKKRGRPRRSA